MANKVYDPETDERPLNHTSATDDELRQITGINREQEGAYDRAATNGAASDIAERAGLFNKGGDAGVSAVGIGASLGSSPMATVAKLGQTFFGSRRRKQATTGGTVIGLLVGGAFFGFTIASGPLELIHLSQILSKNFTHSEDTTKVRARGLFRFARNGEVGETRVGLLGSRSYGKTVAQLKELGIEFNTNKFSGTLESTTIDPAKLSDNIPELKGKTLAQQRSILSDRFNLPESSFSDAGGKIVLTTDSDISVIRGVTRTSTSLLTDSKSLVAIRARPLDKFFDTPSLWHPIKRAKAKLNTKLGQKAALRQEETDRAKAQRAAIEPEAEAVSSDLAGKFSGVKLAAGGALLVTAAACLARDSADDIIAFNRAAIVVPAVAGAADKIAVGAQVQSGQDVDANALGAVADSFTDATGKTIWQGKALQETAEPGSGAGEDVTPDIAQAFLPNNTAANIKDTVGGGGLGALACSPAGKLTQLVGGLALLAASIPSGGLSTAGLFALKTAGTVAGTAGAFYLIQHTVVDLLKDKAVVPEVLSGPAGGNILAYGAREAGGIEARSSGGVALSDKESAYIDANEKVESDQQFASKSIVARLFDTHDYRSLTSRAVDSTSPNVTQNVDTIASSIMSLGHISELANTFFPKAKAATQPYQWASPRYGIPSSVLDNPDYADPYDNADKVAAVLDNDTNSTYINRASACFGDTVSKGSDGWQVEPKDDVNPNSQAYTDAHCNDLSDPNWQRMMLFVIDSRTMDAAACLDNTDSEACNISGVGDTGSGDAATSATVDDSTVYQDSSSVQCAPGTNDIGVQTGYHGGNPINIRLCAVPNLPSASAESQAGNSFSVAGANGDALVNSRISGAFYTMVQAAAADGVTLKAESSFRTMDHQQDLCNKNSACRAGDHTKVAEPGNSNHQMGLAIDFAKPDGVTAITKGDQSYNWLSDNAAKFGIKNYPVESWHWSATGN